MADEPQISDAEWQVMNVIWERAPIPSAEIVQILEKQTGWRPSTVKTMLARLVKKGVLAFDQEGNRYVYRPKLDREDCAQRATKSFLTRVFGGEALPMVLHFVQSGQISKKEIKALRRVLDEMESKHGRR